MCYPPSSSPRKHKKTICKFCDGEIVSNRFARHLQRHHREEREVKKVLSFPRGSKERKRLLEIIRNSGNLEAALRGYIIPKRRNLNNCIADFAICIHCKGYYRRHCLTRHRKTCFANTDKKSTTNAVTESIIFSASQKTFGEVLNKSRVKEIFSRMRPDEITIVAIDDPVIVLYGESLFQKTKTKKALYHVSNALRECARYLVEMRKLGSYTTMLSTLVPEAFGDCVRVVKKISKFDIEKQSFGAASLASRFGTHFKKITDVAQKLILQQKVPIVVNDTEKTLLNLKKFRTIVEKQWGSEIGNLALKELLNKKSSIKLQLLPITEDIMKLKAFLESTATEAYNKLGTIKCKDSYNTLAECTLILTFLHNRRGMGDIQYMDLNSYTEKIMSENFGVEQKETEYSLTQHEKILTQHYRRMKINGKGGTPVTILIPKGLQPFYLKLATLRLEQEWFSPQNTFFFAYYSGLKWIDGCCVIQKYAKRCEVKRPELLTYCRLRRHIATVTQVLSLKEKEIDQLVKVVKDATGTQENFDK